MLILTRKPGQALSIGDDITITVLSATDSNVRIGIDAPRDLDILREEAKMRTRKTDDWYNR